MYFSMKSTLKNNHNHNHTSKHKKFHRGSCVEIFARSTRRKFTFSNFHVVITIYIA